MTRFLLVASLCALAACQHVAAPSTPREAAAPPVGQRDVEIKALSPDEVQGYLRGGGLGYAKAAELNGYPGPRHVLDLADSLALSPDQRRRVEASFQSMQAEARTLGQAYVAAEAVLDRAFAEGPTTPERVRALTEAAARAEGEIRAVHLTAHLDMMSTLTPDQVATYNRLQGHARGGHSEGHQGPHH